ncbi:RNA polymerase III subunit C11 [Penicillium macrosclerotiorum]|uniref:RNA polymerase III subunit C11 n=1 Tax=Penicillium macrosclerotiorum TaxID=303699 RepID=UPI0025484311|nr:RNA polymerase III subunit C11 [Penicillium macrosclerotiorum]KAJ5678716.1 RNA polymerase III subunit C11 [Penicillium macrosclerotiorum]
MGINRFECRTCPYQDVIPTGHEYYEKSEVKEKEVEGVFGGKEEFANADSIGTQCPAEKCNGERAYFFQLQIRSADEPMTTFLKCTTCGVRWREN